MPSGSKFSPPSSVPSTKLRRHFTSFADRGNLPRQPFSHCEMSLATLRMTEVSANSSRASHSVTWSADATGASAWPLAPSSRFSQCRQRSATY